MAMRHWMYRMWMWIDANWLFSSLCDYLDFLWFLSKDLNLPFLGRLVLYGNMYRFVSLVEWDDGCNVPMAMTFAPKESTKTEYVACWWSKWCRSSWTSDAIATGDTYYQQTLLLNCWRLLKCFYHFLSKLFCEFCHRSVTLGLKPPKSGHQDHTMHPRGYFLWPGGVVSFKRQERICQSLCFRKLIIYFESQETWER